MSKSNRGERSWIRFRLVAGLVSITALALASCGGDRSSRVEVMRSMTEEAVPERYQNLASDAKQLVALVAQWCEADTDSEGQVLEQLTTVRDGWGFLRPFYFGPVMTRRSTNLVDYPASEEKVREMLANDRQVDATSLREFAAANQRGIGVVEVLVAGEPNARTCDYALGAATLAADELEQLADDWRTYGPDTASDAEQSDDTLTALIGETLSAFALTSSDNSRRPGHLAGARWVMFGDGGSLGIAELLSDEVRDRLTADFDRLAEEASFDAAMAVEATIRTNVVAELGITVNFSDADGDG